MSEVDGETLMARSLKQQGVDYMFGVVGFPVWGAATAAQREGIQFIGMRNEQSASYAAAAVGYLTGRPGACLVVAGPGLVHGLAGLANAAENCWPMIVIGGAGNSYQEGMGSFQEAPQVEWARPYTKFAARPDSAATIPRYVEQAVRTSISGRPGGVYIDFPNDMIEATVDESEVNFPPRCPDASRPQAASAEVERAIEVLHGAERPLVIVGKGAAYARARKKCGASSKRRNSRSCRHRWGRASCRTHIRSPWRRAERSRSSRPTSSCSSAPGSIGFCITGCLRASPRTSR